MIGLTQLHCHFATALLAVVNPVFNPVLEPASHQAGALSRLFVITLFVCAVIFVIVTALVLLCIVRFRKGTDEAEPEQIAGNAGLEITWTVASILVLVVLFALTVQAMHISDPPADRDPDITVIGHQWWWEVRYANGAVTANEIHIPAHSNLLVRLESADVIHDFWVPQLGRKMDMIPGHPNFIWLSANEPSEYLGTCAEYCGAQHAWMRIRVVAQTPEAFAHWVKELNREAPQPSTPETVRGQRVFEEKTCVNCHAIRGVGPAISVAPDLTHFASRLTIGAGVAQNTPDNLRAWLIDPQQVKPACHMPKFHLTSDEVEALAKYLETLK